MNGPPTRARPTVRDSRSFSAGAVRVKGSVSGRKREEWGHTTLLEELLFLVAEVEEKAETGSYE